MTAAFAIATDPTGLAAPARQLGRWGRLPLKAKAGVVLLGVVRARRDHRADGRAV